MNPLALNALSRRASLLTLGSAGLAAAFARPVTTSAKKKHGKSKGKKGDATKLCKQQVGQCLELFTPNCTNPTCLAQLERCCPVLGDCEFAGYFDCINAPE
jgi:hypothetical protein